MQRFRVMTRQANYFSFWILYMCPKSQHSCLSGSEAFVLGRVQQHKFQNKIKSRHKQKCIVSTCDHIVQWEAYSALRRRCSGKYLTSRESK